MSQGRADMTGRIAGGWAGLTGFFGVAAGAFGAHGVSDAHAKALLQTAGQYAMIHALAALAALVLARLGARPALAAAFAFLAGAWIFAGSLVLIVTTGQPLFGAVTPIGGVSLLAGWALLAWAGIGSGGE